MTIFPFPILEDCLFLLQLLESGKRSCEYRRTYGPYRTPTSYSSHFSRLSPFRLRFYQVNHATWSAYDLRRKRLSALPLCVYILSSVIVLPPTNDEGACAISQRGSGHMPDYLHDLRSNARYRSVHILRELACHPYRGCMEDTVVTRLDSIVKQRGDCLSALPNLYMPL